MQSIFIHNKKIAQNLDSKRFTWYRSRRIWTLDIRFWRPTLYQLNYAPKRSVGGHSAIAIIRGHYIPVNTTATFSSQICNSVNFQSERQRQMPDLRKHIHIKENPSNKHEETMVVKKPSPLLPKAPFVCNPCIKKHFGCGYQKCIALWHYGTSCHV